jgi:hypothetical protein
MFLPFGVRFDSIYIYINGTLSYSVLCPLESDHVAFKVLQLYLCISPIRIYQVEMLFIYYFRISYIGRALSACVTFFHSSAECFIGRLEPILLGNRRTAHKRCCYLPPASLSVCAALFFPVGEPAHGVLSPGLGIAAGALSNGPAPLLWVKIFIIFSRRAPSSTSWLPPLSRERADFGLVRLVVLSQLIL